jgi:glycosyltransferase involved in cell wall biosynthesis
LSLWFESLRPLFENHSSIGNALISESVAVVIPFHNGSAWIERALKSVIDQTHRPNELIVVDDGSRADESAKLELLKAKYSFKLFYQENSGQSAARNLGVSKAGSDYICFLDQDDYFLPNHIDVLLEASNLETEKFGFSYGDLLRVTESGDILSQSSLTRPHPLKDSQSMISQNMHILPSATLIKRSSFLEVGGFDESLQGYEDDNLFLRFHLAGFTIDFTPEPVSAWTVNRSSTSFSESMSKSRFLFFKKLMGLFRTDLVEGKSVFESALFPRFAYKFADDVIYSALNGGEHFKERVWRLKAFVEEVRNSKNMVPATRLSYLVATWPLVVLDPKPLRVLLSIALKIAPVLRVLKINLLDEFLSRHSPVKKSV